ncbi:MAG TPA: bifunctional aspartate kinase/homoserine dehydrogenase I, partial [Chloroflexia bacterium]|nr:bifunctional aspartate kinase/homoserine dehydrogenase I [Chloroflexia bacterium]
MDIVQLGLGGVGQALIGHVLALGPRYPWLRYTALADRSGVAWQPGGWTADGLRALLAAKGEGRALCDAWPGLPANEGRFIPAGRDLPAAVLPALTATGPGGSVLVDVTAERGIYPTVLAARAAGAHVVLCNKWALAEPQDRYDALLAAGPGRLLYETTVGAALPVLSTLDGLLQTGDEVTEIQASISGTLGYVTSRITEGIPFSTALREAQEQGYTEPDPRDDLAGIDARRKALILARKLGMRLDMADLRVDSLVPPGLEDVPQTAFWEALPAVDGAYARRAAVAHARGDVLRFLATIDGSGARVGLEEVPLASLPGTLTGTESLFVFHTRRYGAQPLAVRGRGAGAELTAAGVLSDLLTL